ncbi:MAG: tRNA dihydrouridine synthase DusB [Burkholderiaceae bacterium]|nr:tRNA dihydrouridine synthase DusB [Burkholderiaceae bacterium]
MHIGPYVLPHPVLLAPMAGVTDQPFRQLCRGFGAGYAVSEMVSARPDLQRTLESRRRAAHEGEPGLTAVQIVGADPVMMAEAARQSIGRGARIIDINMGCPSRKVCSRWAGSALMQDEPLALRIIDAVVAACAPHGVPVTLKMRTGWSGAHRNAPRLARAAQEAGVRMIAVHGRTREQGYRDQAEYRTIAEVKAAVRVPVVANGDIDSPEKAQAVLAASGADAVMVGRAAWGRPWIFREVAHFLATGRHLAPPLVLEVRRALLAHLHAHYRLYGLAAGARSARKHIGWCVRGLPGGAALRERINTMEHAGAQARAVADYFSALAAAHDRLPAAAPAVPQEARSA